MRLSKINYYCRVIAYPLPSFFVRIKYTLNIQFEGPLGRGAGGGAEKRWLYQGGNLVHKQLVIALHRGISANTPQPRYSRV